MLFVLLSKTEITYRRRYEECEFDERSKLTEDDRAYYDIDGTDIPVEAMKEFQDDFEESVDLLEGHGGGVRVEDSANNSDSDADHEEANENLVGVSDQEAGDELVEGKKNYIKWPTAFLQYVRDL